MVMKIQNCTQLIASGANSIETSISTLCSLILAERNIIGQMNYPNALKDLFIEQSEI